MDTQLSISGKTPDPADSLVTLYSNKLQVKGTTSPTFILHAADGRSALPENSMRYLQTLQQNGVK